MLTTRDRCQPITLLLASELPNQNAGERNVYKNSYRFDAVNRFLFLLIYYKVGYKTCLREKYLELNSSFYLYYKYYLLLI